MPTPFAITAAAPSVRLGADRTGSATFTVANTAGQAVRGEARVWTEQPEARSWMSVEEPAERDFLPGGAHQFTVRFTPPATVAPGSYAFRLDLISRERPDDESAMGQVATVEVPPAPVPTKQPRRFPWWLLLVALAVLVVAGLVFRACAAPRQVTVPKVEGLTQGAAGAVLEKAGLKVGKVTEQASGDPPGTVLHQSPGVGSKLREGEPVDLVVVARPATGGLVRVPKVEGLSRDAAAAVLEKAGFTVGDLGTELTGTAQPGTVTTQDPPPGTPVAAGRAVGIALEPRPERSTSATLRLVENRIDGSKSSRPMLDFDTGTVHNVGLGQPIPTGVDVMLTGPRRVALVPQPPATAASTGRQLVKMSQCLQGLGTASIPAFKGTNGCLRTDQGRRVQLSVPDDVTVENEQEPGIDSTVVTARVRYSVWAAP